MMMMMMMRHPMNLYDFESSCSLLPEVSEWEAFRVRGHRGPEEGPRPPWQIARAQKII